MGTAAAGPPFRTLRGRELRVAVFAGNYNFTPDGANRALNRLVGFLTSRGVATRVYSPTQPRGTFPHAGDLVSVPSIPAPGRPDYRIGVGLPRTVRADLARFRPTLFHVSAPDLIGAAALNLGRASGIPVVASYHTRFETYLRYYGLAALERPLLAYLRWFYRRCDQLYAPSPCMAELLRGWDFNPDVRLWTRGVDRCAFSPAQRDVGWRVQRGFRHDDVVIAFVGRLVREKGLDILRDTAAAVARTSRRCRFLIVGDGPEGAALRTALPDAVFTGYLHGAALATAYASADVFFNPSQTETFGNVTLEAMASGLAVVCAPATGSRSLIQDGVTGLIVAPPTAHGFAGAILALEQDSALRQRLQVRAREASTGYDWTTILESVLRHYADAVANHGLTDRPALPLGTPERAVTLATG